MPNRNPTTRCNDYSTTFPSCFSGGLPEVFRALVGAADDHEIKTFLAAAQTPTRAEGAVLQLVPHTHPEPMAAGLSAGFSSNIKTMTPPSNPVLVLQGLNMFQPKDLSMRSTPPQREQGTGVGCGTARSQNVAVSLHA